MTEEKAVAEVRARLDAHAKQIQVFSDSLEALSSHRDELLDGLSELLSRPFIFPESFEGPELSPAYFNHHSSTKVLAR